jgi:hypothetical protein
MRPPYSAIGPFSWSNVSMMPSFSFVKWMAVSPALQISHDMEFPRTSRPLEKEKKGGIPPPKLKLPHHAAGLSNKN